MLRSEQPRDPDERKKFNESQVAAREKVRQIERLEACAALLKQAALVAESAGLDVKNLDDELRRVQNSLTSLTAERPGRIVSRTRPAAIRPWRDGERGHFTLFIDESGGTRQNLSGDQPYFALGGLLISDLAYKALEQQWNAWKVRWIGREKATMHAKQPTRKSIGYYAVHGGTPDQALASLEELLDGFDCTLFVAAIDKRAFLRDFCGTPVNHLVPGFHYGLALTFLLERAVHCLLSRDDASADVIAESRSRHEDAEVQIEYQRLQIEGPPYQG